MQIPFSLDLAEPIQTLTKTQNTTFVNVGNLPAKSFLMSQLLEGVTKQTPNIFWATSEHGPGEIEPNLKLFLGRGKLSKIPQTPDVKFVLDFYHCLSTPTPTIFLFEAADELFDQKIPTSASIKNQKIPLEVEQKLAIFDLFGDLEKSGFDPASDKFLQPGEFQRTGDTLYVFDVTQTHPYKIDLWGDQIESISFWDQETKTVVPADKKIEIAPVKFQEGETTLGDILLGQKCLFISDDIDPGLCQKFDATLKQNPFSKIRFTTFPQEEEAFFHINFFSVLPFYTIPDFVTDIKERFRRGFEIMIVTKKKEELLTIFHDNQVMWTEDMDETMPSTVKLQEIGKDEFMPHSFQNNDQKFLFLTDREIFHFFRKSAQKKAIAGLNTDLLNSLKFGDYVIHTDHGCARFEGIIQRDLGGELGVREFLKLSYAGSDNLFVPVEFAEKVAKFIGESDPKLTRLHSSEWEKSQKKIKKETEKIAGELLKLYAARQINKSQGFDMDSDLMQEFYDAFPYTLTPGQAKAWADVKADMERDQPMDRLVCGDVGFGKTEIAMRAAYKAATSGKQAIILAPITILAEQHYLSFQKRLKGLDTKVSVALMSRFQTPAEQKKVLKDLELGLVDIVIGTHRLLSDDVKVKNLGILIIDEEQRFGVKQKEKLKSLRANVDIMTLTATPIPRTLNMSLSKLKDISTITTPPPGRLPVVTEVRRFNLNLIRDRVLFEVNRGGQVYFLHNEVRTIESQAENLRKLIPEVSFIVAHGQMTPQELESRIRQFKKGEVQVLIASTIIENGIDMPNANTLIVNKADKFGLSQLYQLRGRVGRGRTQAHAYFLYQGQKLEFEARKRLRAIVEASELGAGFQIAMRDLEIRGAGEILGANQSGTIKSVGVSHFMRMLHKTVERMKKGEIDMEVAEEEENVAVEIPLNAYIPPEYIPRSDEKIRLYQEIAAAETIEGLNQVELDTREDFGTFPEPVRNLFRIVALKIHGRAANVSGIRIHKVSQKKQEIIIRMGKKFSPQQVFGLMQHSEKDWKITATTITLAIESLPVNWFDELVEDIQYLIPKEEKETSK